MYIYLYSQQKYLYSYINLAKLNINKWQIFVYYLNDLKYFVYI